MASDEQRARLLHAALVKAYECEKCSWKKSECEKCSLMWHEIKGCRECLGPHYDTHRLNRTFGPPLHLLIKRVNLSDWNLIGPECSDAATEAKDCQIGEVVVNSRGRGSSSPSGVRGVNKTLWQEIKERKEAVFGRGCCEEAEKFEKSRISPSLLRGIAKALDGETGTGWTTTEPGSTSMGKHRREEESQGPEKESKKRPRSNTCELDCGRSPTIAPCRLCERRCCRECLEGDFKCDGGTGEFQCKECDPWQTSSLVQPRIWFIPVTSPLARDPAQSSLDHPGHYFIPVPPALVEPLSRSLQ